MLLLARTRRPAPRLRRQRRRQGLPCGCVFARGGTGWPIAAAAVAGLLCCLLFGASAVCAQRAEAAGLMAYIPRNSLTKGKAAWQIGDKTPVDVQKMRKAKADSGFFSPLMLPTTYGHVGHTQFTLPRSNPRDWGMDPNLASMYQTWPDVAGTDYAQRMPSNYYHLTKRFHIDKPEALPPWQMHREILHAENPPAFSNLEPMIPAGFMG